MALEGEATLASIGFIRFVRRTVFIVDAMTVLCAVLFVGWYKNWRDLPLSFVFDTQKHTDSEVYSTASIDKIASATNFATLLQLPIIVLLLLAVAFLTAFYLWLHDTEIRLTRANR
jgi:hypothetical protein